MQEDNKYQYIQEDEIDLIELFKTVSFATGFILSVFIVFFMQFIQGFKKMHNLINFKRV